MAEKLLKMQNLNFCPIKTDMSGNTVWPQASGFQKLAKMDHFELTFVPQNVNVARFARNVEWDFFCDFQTPCVFYKNLPHFLFWLYFQWIAELTGFATMDMEMSVILKFNSSMYHSKFQETWYKVSVC